MRFFVGCAHFGHANIIKYSKRPYSSVHEMNKGLTDNWNSVVKPEDTVYNLGDFAFGSPDVYASKLNGKHILILGNHDKESQCAGHFAEIHRQLEIEIDGKKVMLHHHPYKDSIDPLYDNKFKDRMLDRRGNIWLIHSHIHNGPSSWRVNNRQINVGVDVNNYFPVSETEIIEIINGAK